MSIYFINCCILFHKIYKQQVNFFNFLMSQTKFIHLPSIRNQKYEQISTFRPISRQTQKMAKPIFTNRWQRKLSLNPKETITLEKYTFTKQKHPLLRKFSVGKIQSKKTLSNKKTKDTSISDNNQQINSQQKCQNVTEKALAALKNMSQVEKVEKLYREQKISNQKKQKKFDSIKCRCLVKQNVFQKKQYKLRHKLKKSSFNEGQSKTLLKSADQFWNSINQSLILECEKREEPSKDLKELMEYLVTQ